MIDSASASRDLPASRRPADQHGAIARQHGGGVHAGAPPSIMGSNRRQPTTKRAPSTPAPAPSAPTPWRFSDPDAAVMRLDDLLGDRQAEARVLAEALMRPVGVEALEDPLQRVLGRMPGPSSSTTISISFLTRRQVTRTVPPGGENDARCRSGCRSPVRAANRGRAPRRHRSAPPSNQGSPTPSSWRTSLATADQRVEQLGAGRPGAILALHFGIEPAGVGDVGDQPVEPLDVVLDDREQRARLSSVLASGSVSTAERSEVSGFFSSWATSAAKHLDRLDAAVEGIGHVAQRAGQMADLVAAAGEIGISTRERMRRRTRSAPSASRRTGPAMVPASSRTAPPSRRRRPGTP